MRVEHDVELAMTDGAVLRADAYRPDDGAPRPVILQRTPYDKGGYGALGEYWVDRGFMCVLQDVRGQHASDGVFEPVVNEAADGAATVEWAAGLPGSDGRVALVGTSYLAQCALRAAILRPAGLVAVAVGQTPVSFHEDWLYPGGAFNLAFLMSWLTASVGQSAARRLPDGEQVADALAATYQQMGELRVAGPHGHLPIEQNPALFPDRPEVSGYYHRWLTDDRGQVSPTMADLDLAPHLGAIQVPVLVAAGWYDIWPGPSIGIHQLLREAGRDSHLVCGPWSHNLFGRSMNGVDFGPDAGASFPGLTLEFLRNQFAGSQPAERVRWFSMGDNTWHRSDHWPPDGFAPQRWNLSGTALRPAASVTASDADADAVAFRYDPADPTPALGGHSCCFQPASPMGPADQRPIEALDDVAVFTSDALEAPVRVAGPVTAHLVVTTDAVDTDFVAILTDVHPDGESRNLAEGIIRLSSLGPVTPGEPMRADVALQPTGHTFGAGHRIRLDVTSSLFPTYERNLNTGRQVGTDETVVAHQQVLTGPNGSWLELYVS